MTTESVELPEFIDLALANYLGATLPPAKPIAVYVLLPDGSVSAAFLSSVADGMQDTMNCVIRDLDALMAVAIGFHGDLLCVAGEHYLDHSEPSNNPAQMAAYSCAAGVTYSVGELRNYPRSAHGIEHWVSYRNLDAVRMCKLSRPVEHLKLWRKLTTRRWSFETA